ncbi:hypothetical protein K7G98_34415, partial [Saccharothrix sp. MB29]|nr:hypothetical protein [Saccharothrix sp. MB29]
VHTRLDGRSVPDIGPTFLRLHVIDMDGLMDVEFGAVTREAIEGDDRVRADGWEEPADDSA